MEKEIHNDLKTDIELSSKEQRILELEKKLAQYSHELYENDNEIMSQEEYEELFLEYESLINQPVVSKKVETFWDKISLWIPLYGLFQIIFCLPWIMYYSIGVKVLYLFSKWFSQAAIKPDIVILLAFYIVPFFNLMVSWLIYLNLVKGKDNKKFFIIVWILQALIIIGGGLHLYLAVLSSNM